ncbi:MAG: hypothetical protein AB7O21_10455 [Gammaproteobacteria bacterium]
MSLQRFSLRSGLLLLSMWMCTGVYADDDRRLGMRSRDDHHGGYYVPRPRTITPTRPFFVQPYPRYDDSRRAYRHGYREGYRDGSDRRGHGRRGYRGDDRHHGRDRHDGGFYQPRGFSGYAPRPGFSIYYDR